MKEVWNEVNTEAIKVLGEKVNNRRQNYEAVIAGKKKEKGMLLIIWSF